MVDGDVLFIITITNLTPKPEFNKAALHTTNPKNYVRLRVSLFVALKSVLRVKCSTLRSILSRI